MSKNTKSPRHGSANSQGPRSAGSRRSGSMPAGGWEIKGPQRKGFATKAQGDGAKLSPRPPKPPKG